MLSRESFSAALKYKLVYRNFVIRVKGDFGSSFHIPDNMPVAWGFIYTFERGNLATPGCCWFKTVEDAKLGIDAHYAVGGDAQTDLTHDQAMMWYDVIRQAKARAARASSDCIDDVIAWRNASKQRKREQALVETTVV